MLFHLLPLLLVLLRSESTHPQLEPDPTRWTTFLPSQCPSLEKQDSENKMFLNFKYILSELSRTSTRLKSGFMPGRCCCPRPRRKRCPRSRRRPEPRRRRGARRDPRPRFRCTRGPGDKLMYTGCTSGQSRGLDEFFIDVPDALWSKS